MQAQTTERADHTQRHIRHGGSDDTEAQRTWRLRGHAGSDDREGRPHTEAHKTRRLR